MTTTLDLVIKVHAMAIQPYNRENNAALKRIVSAIISSIVCAGVSSIT